MLVHAIIILKIITLTVQSDMICESVWCVCRHSKEIDGDLVGELIHCAYQSNILDTSLSLPNTAYTLDLSRNNISNVPPSKLLNSNSLVELYLNDNVIKEISNNVLKLPNLKKLDLSDNELEFVHTDTFKYINQLEYLNLANNWFTNFEKISFHHLGNLKQIVLDNNDLGASVEENNLFDRSGYGLTHKIQSLSISGINLNSVPENFFVDVYDLKRLDISNNNLVAMFELPFTLEYLDLSNNPIDQISGEDFTDLVALKELKLNDLLIKEVPDFALAGLHSLTILDIERNKNLTKFSATAFGQDVLEDADDFTLEQLSLRGSRLTTLDERLKVPLGQLIKLDLQGNFWNCDCNLLWIKTLQIKPQDYEHLRCFTPKPLYNSRIFDLKKRYFSCPANKSRVGTIIAVSSLCLLLTTLALWIFLFLPKYQSRCNFVKNMAVPTAHYSMLPVTSGVRDL